MKLIIIISIILLTLATIIHIKKADKQYFKFLNSNRYKSLDTFFIFLTQFGALWFIGIFNVIFAYFIYDINQKWAYLIPIITFSCSGSNTLLKYIFKRKRPNVKALVIENGYSFPSGHSMVSSCFYTLIAIFLSTVLKTNIFIIITSILIILIAYSRIHLGVHYPVDILTGLSLGLIFTIIGLKTLPYMEILLNNNPFF